mgnify:FL=1
MLTGEGRWTNEPACAPHPLLLPDLFALCSARPSYRALSATRVPSSFKLHPQRALFANRPRGRASMLPAFSISAGPAMLVPPRSFSASSHAVVLAGRAIEREPGRVVQQGPSGAEDGPPRDLETQSSRLLSLCPLARRCYPAYDLSCLPASPLQSVRRSSRRSSSRRRPLRLARPRTQRPSSPSCVR